VISEEASQSSSPIVSVAVGVVVGAVLVIVAILVVVVVCCRRRTNEKHPSISSEFPSLYVVLFHQFLYAQFVVSAFCVDTIASG